METGGPLYLVMALMAGENSIEDAIKSEISIIPELSKK
jgi:hypothetical protein